MSTNIHRFGALDQRSLYFFAVCATLLLGVAALGSARNRWVPCTPVCPPPTPEPVLVGYLVNGKQTVQTAPPSASTSEVGVLTRDPVSNGISIDYGPQWNGRFESS